ncbi:hypothetical protein [Enterococcus plantarum]|uniref:hypothetical protein n=1 Tax=Enterococcus TaxID=1350 RepID=UPI001A904F9A|nr:hypothetical protein [Enterococcus plantarum]MBO0466067.1 hypothetical protein [Enterococcus plantarum]
MTPSEMIAKYGVDDPDVKKRINDINNGISYTALNKLKMVQMLLVTQRQQILFLKKL